MRKTHDATCELTGHGFTRTLDGVYDWARAAVAEARQNLQGGPIALLVWGYRVNGYEYLSANFDTPAGEDFSMTFLIGVKHHFPTTHLEDIYQPPAPDMSEALHMLGIVAEALGATITLGLRRNEVNRHCTLGPWQEGQTNAPLALP